MQSSQQTDEETMLKNLQRHDSPVTAFFRQESIFQRVFAAIFSSVIYTLWVARVVQGTIELVVLCSIYSVTVFVLITIKYEDLEIEILEDRTVYTYTRSGVSWKALLDIILGSSIVFVSAYFLVLNGVIDNPLWATSVAMIAVILHVLIVPLHPLLSNTSLDVLKTQAIWFFGRAGLSLDLRVHRLDLPWSRNTELLEREMRTLLTDVLGEEPRASSSIQH